MRKGSGTAALNRNFFEGGTVSFVSKQNKQGNKMYHTEAQVTTGLIALTLESKPFKGKNGEYRICQLAFVPRVW
ncbi:MULTISPECIES: hypothetical protein [unclassified Paenibacillus]|uniref:hypothetical protein n=1 Tax=unclassified Paenibacillus TaxID=185978 RepID=UPI0024053442|nr:MULTISPECIES: hypothetical protein [unclassified Paenibacillus]MDF9839736.1 hypothetical protein [Paenibacillus sp. PastF-2]MDF9846316.1 hypothetical protein [Paenibacillus sp. PastM-2]MDF9853334.1 hypothetical protein [Paenibacillus sp. PastF-1]MDH6478162.1 hypothetical protein [Paenibacillus sp. PastH-2]MDH6506339.1 hypothetical protein [Paenibacillus sp. PastM-3]